MNESKEEDLISVLRNLGFKVKEAKQRADSVLAAHDEEVPLEVLIKEAMAWTRQPTGSLTIQTAVTSKTENPSGPLAAKLVWKAPAAPGEAADSSALPWIVTPVVLMAGLMLWIGVVKSLMVLGGLVLFVYLLGRYIPDSAT